MEIENNKKEIKHIKAFGFKKKYLDDKSGFWFQKKMKHKLLGNVLFTIEDFKGEGIICVDLEDEETGFFVTVIRKIYKRKRLTKLLTFFYK